MMELQPFKTEREWTADGIPVLSASVSMPQPVPLTGKSARRLHRYYQLQCRSYLRYCEKMLFPQAEREYRAALATSAPLPLFHAELSYQVTYQDSRFLSLYTQSCETAPQQKLTLRRGDTWDLIHGYPVPLSDFFPDRSGWKRQLLALVENEIQRQEQAGISRYHEGWRKALRRHFNTQNYYLTHEGLVLFFPMYALAPAVEGIPAFLFPYGKEPLSRPESPQNQNRCPSADGHP